jgi:hypothetical protein
MAEEGSAPARRLDEELLGPVRESRAYLVLVIAVAASLLLVLAFNFYLPGPGILVMPLSVAPLALTLVWAIDVRRRVEQGEPNVSLAWPPPDEALVAAGIALVLTLIGTGIIKISGA